MSPGLPVNLTRATKPALIDEVQRAHAELAELRSLLTAIAELAVVPSPSRQYIEHDDPDEYEKARQAMVDAQRERAISVHCAALRSDRFGEKTLRKYATEENLGYAPAPHLNGFALHDDDVDVDEAAAEPVSVS